MISPGLGSKCGHPRAKVQGRCKDCGAVTNSHRLTETRTFLGQTFEVPVMASYPTQCPDCGDPVQVLAPAVQCHKCWTAEHG